jgi:hypothetical protein
MKRLGRTSILGPGEPSTHRQFLHVGAWTAASTAPITTTADLINTKKGKRVIGDLGGPAAR